MDICCTTKCTLWCRVSQCEQ